MSGKTFNLRMTDQEYERLEQLSKAMNCPMSQVLKSTLLVNDNLNNNITNAERRMVYERMKKINFLLEKIEKETKYNTYDCREEMMKTCQLLSSSMKANP